MNKNLLTAIILGIVTYVIYWFSYTGEVAHLNYFVPLSDALLHGRLYLTENPPWLNELILFRGVYFVVYPPMPAILMIPIVAIFGSGFEQPLFSMFIGALNVSLCFWVLLKLFKKKNLAILGSVLFGFGTMHWFHAQAGSAWYIAHIIAIFFIWLSILEVLGRKRFLLVGLLMGAAYWSRLPAILAVVFPLFYLNKNFILFKPKLKINFRNLLLLSLGVVSFIILNALYNFARFGVFYDISYQLLPVFNEPWYKNGLFSVLNIPIHLKEILFGMPTFSAKFPYIIPSLFVMAIWIVTPAFLLLPLGSFRKKLDLSLLLTIIIMSIPGLAHGSNGFTQVGFRFSLEYHPFLVLLLASIMNKNEKLYKIGIVLILMSILINSWFILSINYFDKWTM